MFSKRISCWSSKFAKSQYSSAQFVSSLDKSSTAATLARPVDAFIFKHEKKKDYSELYKFEGGALVDEDLANQIAQDTFKVVKQEQSNLPSRVADRPWQTPAKDTDLIGDQKYTLVEAETQYKNVIDALTNAGFVDEEEQKKKENETKTEEETADAAMEGGEQADTDFLKLAQYQDDPEDYSGKGNIAKLLLKQTIVSPIFGDLLKGKLLEPE
jgi:hypothetical protein